MKEKYYAGWLPQNRRIAAVWVNNLLGELQQNNMFTAKISETEYKYDEVTEFKNAVMAQPELRLLCEQMIEQGYAYDKEDPMGKPQINSMDQLFTLIDKIIDIAPEYMQQNEEGRGLIGFPLNAVLDWCMGTQAGYAFFLNKDVNRHLNKILSRWCDNLNKPASLYVLNKSETGWLCKEAIDELKLKDYIIDEKDEHYGFKSWNHFFTRQFKEGMRKVASPDDPYVIVNACECAAYKIDTNVQKDSNFWVKEQNYSLDYMLDHHEYTHRFIGGTVFQAFLSATHYHCWHAPVDGKIVDIKKIPGTYYAEINEYPYDSAGPNDSQGYITHVATRALIMIEADNKDIGMVCFMPVGMSEVSSCDVTVQIGDTVKKGDLLGKFLFGGSTHCLFFEKNVIDTFVKEAIPAADFNDSPIMEVCSKLAVAKRKNRSGK